MKLNLPKAALYDVMYDVCVCQLAYQLEQERKQRTELERSRRKLEGDSKNTMENFSELGKMRANLEELIKK